MKSIKITLFLIAGLTALQPNIFTISVSSELACERQQEKTSWLSRNKGKIAISILLAGVCVYTKYAFDKDTVTTLLDAAKRKPQLPPTAQLSAPIAALLTAIQDPEEKLIELGEKIISSTEKQLERAAAMSKGASTALQIEIGSDTGKNIAQMALIEAREALGESCKMDRLGLWIRKRGQFASYGIEKAWGKLTKKIQKRIL